MKRNRKHSVQGFSLVELMVVILIIGMLAGGAALAAYNMFGKATEKIVKQDITKIEEACKLYKMNEKEGKFPDSLTALKERGYLEREALDPWNRPYLYELQNGKPFLKTLGSDGQPGGEGEDQDWDSNSIQQATKE